MAHLRRLSPILLLIGHASPALARSTSLPKTPQDWIIFFICFVVMLIWWKWPTGK